MPKTTVNQDVFVLLVSFGTRMIRNVLLLNSARATTVVNLTRTARCSSKIVKHALVPRTLGFVKTKSAGANVGLTETVISPPLMVLITGSKAIASTFLLKPRIILGGLLLGMPLVVLLELFVLKLLNLPFIHTTGLD
jgi:hypothetical protein